MEPMTEANPREPNTELCRKMLSPHNIEIAVRNVKRNGGSGGIDGMEIKDLDAYLKENWPQIEEQILTRKYKPQPVRRKEIEKENGGVRLLGIPCLVDRVIQQAMVQVLQPVFEPTFSEYSYGFRPKRSAEDAVRQAQIYMAEGYTHVVDLDLSKFFDTVNHELLMSLVDVHMKDKDIRRLIYEFLKCGVMSDGSFIATEAGTPQGGPLSPLLSNIYLTPYDKKLEERGLKFVRYADDCNIFTKSNYSCKRVKASAIRFLEQKLKLKVNMEKTEARSAVGSSFLGFTFLTTRWRKNGELGHCRPKEKKLRKFEEKIRELTERKKGESIKTTVDNLNAYLRGWMNYYARSSLKKYISEKAGWIRRRLRQKLWKLWKKGAKRKAELRKLGCKEWQIDKLGKATSNSYWRMAGVLGSYITNKALVEVFGLIPIEETWEKLHEKRMNFDRTYCWGTTGVLIRI